LVTDNVGADGGRKGRLGQGCRGSDAVTAARRRSSVTRRDTKRCHRDSQKQMPTSSSKGGDLWAFVGGGAVAAGAWHQWVGGEWKTYRGLAASGKLTEGHGGVRGPSSGADEAHSGQHPRILSEKPFLCVRVSRTQKQSAARQQTRLSWPQRGPPPLPAPQHHQSAARRDGAWTGPGCGVSA
jgi:hypothetical protein